MKYRLILAAFIGVSSFSLGLLIGQYGADSSESASFASIARDPAAIKKMYDFSNLQGTALYEASKQRLLADVKIVYRSDQVGIELGHYVVRGVDGSKEFACEKYKKVVMYFESEGSATAGERSRMEVEGQCEVALDINRIEPLWIPTARILGERVGDGEYDFTDARVARVKFLNLGDEWPEQWQLRSVRLENPQDTGDTVIIDEKELREFADKPILVNFTQKMTQ